MKKLIPFALLAAGAAVAQENEKPVLVIAAAAAPRAAGGSVGVFREEGRLRYGVSALVTAGDSWWAGGSLEARWAFLQGPLTPYLGIGIGAFSVRRGGLDLGIQPVAAAETGLEFQRFFAGAKLLVPLSSRAPGQQAHDVPGMSDPALLAQLGLRI